MLDLRETRRIAANSELFANPYWFALRTVHSSIALGLESSSRPLALRYPADVIPFAGIEAGDTASMQRLHSLLAPGEAIYVAGGCGPELPGLVVESELPGLQMQFLAAVPEAKEGGPEIVELDAAHASEMVHLTNVAFPGFFRPRTYTLGRYFGVRIEGELVAMAGERLALPGWREISAVCTHPAHTGRGYAGHLIRHLLRVHAHSGLQSFLHLAAANVRARSLYERLGFTQTRELMFHHLRRTTLV